MTLPDLIAMSVEQHFTDIAGGRFRATRSGYTARSITRFRLPAWIVAVSSLEPTCQGCSFPTACTRLRAGPPGRLD